MQVTPFPLETEQLGPFRFGRFGEGWIITNEFGEWHHLDDAAFRALLSGDTDLESDEGEALMAKGFLREGLQLDHVAQAMRRRKKFVGLGPAEHAIPLRSGDATLSVETAKDILDFAMLSTSSALTFHLDADGVAPDLDLLGFLVQYGTEKNRYEGKALTWVLHLDPAAIDADAATWLADKRFRVRTAAAGAVSDDTVAGIARLNEAAAAKKREPSVDVDVVVDATTAADVTDILDALAEHGVATARLVPTLHGDDALGTSAWSATYGAVLARQLEGKGPHEELTAALVSRITRTDADDDVSLRSPTGTGTGAVAYDLAGRIHPSPAARDTDDPDMFVLGTVGETAYKDATTHATLRAFAMASLLECLPGFADHWATPYLGVDPLDAWTTTGDLFHRAPTSAEVAAQVAAVEQVFAVLVRGDEDEVATLSSLAG